ncbi:endospore germination permease [Paenibacillus sp. CF384]|uniref:GerAB/ArcD/ProY family transporter n=1 Tax=Paenibacillus sp. CF384 TaxID=1884382 RepID=UPI0008962AB5|nr:endospore germination permease [Paenibacillus sp. CF384]SDW46411.1 spore germination protein KB [Paenibacillus sp. CF384]
MMEKGRISPLQLSYIMHPYILATLVLSAPAISMVTAGRDMWATPILAGVFACLIVVLMYALHLRYPNETFIEYIESILGRYLGKSLALIYVVSIIYTNAMVLRQYGEFIATTFLIQTPMIVIVTCMMMVCAYALYMGIEAWTRAAQLLIPIALAIILVMLIIMTPDMSLKEMYPIMEYGPFPLLRGSILPASWFSQYFIISTFLPYVTKKSGEKLKWSLISVASVTITMVLINLSILFMFGNLSKAFNYPFLVAVRYISLSDFLEHIEALLMATWLIGIFIKVTVNFYGSVLWTAQWLKLPNYRTIIAPIGLLVILVSIWCAPNYQMLRVILNSSVPVYTFLMQLLVPALLLLIAILKRRKRHES